MTEAPAMADPTLVIAIAGGSASGKTRLTQELATTGPAAVLCQDAYYRTALGPDANFDDPASIDWALFEHHFRDLLCGSSVTTPLYDFTRHARVPHGGRIVTPSSLVIVEGLHVLTRPALRSGHGVAIFVDTPPDIRLLRRVRRDVSERGRTIASVLRQYEQHVRPMHVRHVEPSRRRADLVVDGTRSPGDNVAAVRAFCIANGLAIRGSP